MVSLSVYLDEQAATEMPAPFTLQPPVFRFPMDFTTCGIQSQPITPKRTRQRPATAPGSIEAGHRRTISLNDTYPQSIVRPRIASPLSSTAVPTRRGLGIEWGDSNLSLQPALPVTRGSVSSDCSSTDERCVPSLSFSQLSLTIDPSDKVGPRTPEVYETNAIDWLQSKQETMMKENESRLYRGGNASRRMACV